MLQVSSRVQMWQQERRPRLAPEQTGVQQQGSMLNLQQTIQDCQWRAQTSSTKRPQDPLPNNRWGRILLKLVGLQSRSLRIAADKANVIL